MKSPKEKEAVNFTVRKVITFTPKKVLTEHWKTQSAENKTGQLLSKCEGCSLDHIGEQKSCRKWSNREEIQGSLSHFIKKKGEEPVLEIDQEMISARYKEGIKGPNEHETLVEAVTCDDLDTELINK